MVKRVELKERVELSQILAEDPMYYYKYAYGRGVDYNFYGNWQKNYAKMIISVCEIIRRTEKAKPTMLDVGCACGVNTRAFKESGVFGSVQGCDISEFMINLGRTTHGFSEKELFVASSQKLSGIKTKSIDFIHCTNVFEHCTEDEIKKSLNEFNRVCSNDGIIFIIVPSVKPDKPEVAQVEIIENNVTHITIKPTGWWERLLSRQFEIDSDIYQRFSEDQHSPDNSEKNFYDYYNDEWTLFLLTRR